MSDMLPFVLSVAPCGRCSRGLVFARANHGTNNGGGFFAMTAPGMAVTGLLGVAPA